MELNVILIQDIPAAITVINSMNNFPSTGGVTVYDDNSFFEHQGEWYILYDEHTSSLGSPVKIFINVEYSQLDF